MKNGAHCGAVFRLPQLREQLDTLIRASRPTNFAPCATRNGPQTVHNAHRPTSEALKSVVDVPRETFDAHCAMKCEQCFMF